MKEIFGETYRMDIKELIGRERFGDANLEVVGGESGSPGGVCDFFRAIEGEDAKNAADLRFTEGGGFGFTESAKFAGATMNDFAGELRNESGSFSARSRRVRKNMEIGKWKRIDEAEGGFVVSFGFARESGDDVSTDGGVGKEFADEIYATGVVHGAIPAVHGGEDAVRAGLQG